MSTALISRPQTAPPIRVLEVDGPRQKYCQRGDGHYYLTTDNQPMMPSLLSLEEPAPDPRLTGDWQEGWEIAMHHDGRVEIYANRPNLDEVSEGDLHGLLGSIITLPHVSRHSLKLALRVARKLCRCDPQKGIRITFGEYAAIGQIHSNIPVYLS
jgi:hypothetical protein